MGECDSVAVALEHTIESLRKTLDSAIEYIQKVKVVIDTTDIDMYFNILRQMSMRLTNIINTVNNTYFNELNELIQLINDLKQYIYAYRTYSKEFLGTVEAFVEPLKAETKEYKLIVEVVGG